MKDKNSNETLKIRLLTLFFHISTTYVETFVIPLYKLQKTLQEKIRALHSEEVLHGLCDFSIASKAASAEIRNILKQGYIFIFHYCM